MVYCENDKMAVLKIEKTEDIKGYPQTVYRLQCKKRQDKQWTK